MVEKVTVFLGVVFIVLVNVVGGKFTSEQKLLEVNRKLKLLNKPAVKSIQSEDGDVIDCINIYKQPAFDHPALRNHTIQMRPSNDQTMETTKKKPEFHALMASQLWQKNGSCPEGTIPVRRIQKQELLKASSLDDFGRKKSGFFHVRNRAETTQESDKANHFVHLNDTGHSYVQQENHSIAVLLTQGQSYIGARGDLNVWNPRVVGDDEYSSSQIWLKNGPREAFESVEAGWVVHPSLFGDRRSRLFAYWTTDASKTTGCFNLMCSGFIQTNNQIALGAVIDPVSWVGKPQYHITLSIYKDTNTNNWWLEYGTNVTIGYWPGNILGELEYMATSVQWGGEVFSPKVGTGRHPHTSTSMGSGDFPGFFYGYDTFIFRFLILDYSLTWKYPSWAYPYVDEYECYGAFYKTEEVYFPEFYFGGPGQNWRCP